MKTFYLYAILIILASGCHQAIDIDSNSVLTDSFSVSGVNSKLGFRFRLRSNNVITSCYSANNTKILSYNLTDPDKNHDSIDIPPKYAGRDLFIDPNNNLFIISDDDNTIYCKDRYDNQHFLFTKDADTVPVKLYSIIFPFEIIDNTTVLIALPQYPAYRDPENDMNYHVNSLYYYEISGDSLIRKQSFAPYPETYKHHYYAEIFPLVCRVKKDYTYFMFSNDNILYIHDLRYNKTKEVKINGLDKNNMTPYKNNELGNVSYSINYQTQQAAYVKLLFDAARNELYVLHSLEPNKTKDKSELQLYTDKPLVVNIIDSNFRVRKKMVFKNQSKVFYNNSFCHNGHFYIQGRPSGSNELKVYDYKTY